MPAIWNVNNGYGTNNKKVSSKLTFEVGEKFAGRISGSSDDNEVMVKLTDGWEFTAKLQDAQKFIKNPGLMQFQVTGYEGGKINLSILKKSLKKDEVIDDRIKEFVAKEGFDGEDISLLKSMIEHDISLTRDNITFIKSLMDFNDKIKKDSKEIDDFIQKYIESKDINMDSAEGENIKNALKGFLSKFGGMTKEDILLFIENNIDLNEENIDSFNKLFKGNETLKDILDDVNMTVGDLEEEAINNSKGEVNVIKNDSIKSAISEEEVNEAVDNNSVNKNIASKLYQANEGKSKLSMLGLLKSIAGENNDILKEPLREILNSRSKEFTTSEYKNISGKIEVLNDDNLLDVIGKENISFNKEHLEKVLSNIFEKNITLSDSEASKMEEFINAKAVNNNDIDIKDGNIVFKNNNQNIVINYDKMLKDIQSIFNNRKNDFQGINREIALDNIKNLTPEKIQNFIKDNLNKYNVVTKENLNKIISDIFGRNTSLIKDEIDLLNESITTKNINENLVKDSSKVKVQQSNDILSSEFKNDENIKNLLNKALSNNKDSFSKDIQQKISQNINDISSDKLSNIVKEELIKSNENVDKRVLSRILSEEVKKEHIKTMSSNDIRSSKDIIKSDLNNKITDLKDIVKEIIQKTNNGSTISEKALQFINSNINDFKLFNSISNEYYYLDVPISNNNKEYPCKLIIKDKRKEGKKIDKTNIKMVVAVKTINIGNVDGYLFVRNNKLDVNLKCEKPFIKLLSTSKDKLQEKLNSIGFYSDITVSEKKQEVNLSSCREFFSDNNSTRIDTKV